MAEKYLDPSIKKDKKYYEVGFLDGVMGALKAQYRSPSEFVANSKEGFISKLRDSVAGGLIGGATAGSIGLAIGANRLRKKEGVSALKGLLKKFKTRSKEDSAYTNPATVGAILGLIVGQDIGGRIGSEKGEIKFLKDRGIKKTPFLPLYKYNKGALKEYGVEAKDMNKTARYRGEIAGALVGGSLFGGIAGSQKRDIYGKKLTKGERIGNALTSGITGAAAGAAAVNTYKNVKRMQNQFRGGYSRSSAGPKSKEGTEFSEGLRRHRTKAEAKKDFYSRARAHHPDKGGNEEVFKDINNQWDNFKASGQFDKLSFLRGIREASMRRELSKYSF